MQANVSIWNVKGPACLFLRGLCDKIAEDVEKYANLMAERIVQRSGKAGQSDALVTTLTNVGKHPRLSFPRKR
jgi:DNA-binding ferritin-like protein